MSLPRFWSQPFRYMRWASVEKPTYFYSILIGSMGPLIMAVAPPLRKALGDGPRPAVPLTYPIPTTPRDVQLKGYDDE